MSSGRAEHLTRSRARSAFLGALLSLGCDGGIEQPLPFNHRIHAESDVACDNCHGDLTTRPGAVLPRLADCMTCHEMDLTTNPAAERWISLMRELAKAGRELEWVRLYELPHTVYYSHRRHVGFAQLPCTTCHGDIGQSTSPPSTPVPTTIVMDTCMGCHEERGVANDCSRCHR